MKVSVRYYGVFRDITGSSTAEFELPDDATVGDLLDQMRTRYGRGFQDRVLDERMGVQSYVLLFLGDEQVDGHALKATRLSAHGPNAHVSLYVLPGSTGGT